MATDIIPPPPPPTPDPGGVSKTTWVIAGAVVVAGLLIAAAIVISSGKSDNPSEEARPAQRYTIEGELSAPECGGGYDIEFASVDVRDQNDRLIGSGSTSSDQGGSSCVVRFDVDVPKANFYQIKIGTHGGPSYSFEDLQTNDFELQLSLD